MWVFVAGSGKEGQFGGALLPPGDDAEVQYMENTSCVRVWCRLRMRDELERGSPKGALPNDIFRVRVGTRHALCITEGGALWTAGLNEFGQLGRQGRTYVSCRASFDAIHYKGD